MKYPRRNEGEAESLAKLCLDVRMLQKLTTPVLRLCAPEGSDRTLHQAYRTLDTNMSGKEIQVRRDVDVRLGAGGDGRVQKPQHPMIRLGIASEQNIRTLTQ